MTTPNHFAQGFIVCALTGLPLPVAAVGGVMMASNDIPVWIDSAKAMLQARKAGDKKWYEVRLWQKRPLMHEVSGWMIAGVFLSAVGLFFSVPGSIMSSFPMVHHVEDLPLHKPDGGINAAFKPAEYATWGLMLLVALFRYTSLKFIVGTF